MAKTLGDFLSQLITKGGNNPADDKFKVFFGNAELVKAEVPDDVATAIDNGLISIKDAKNNHPEIKNHYFKQALDGVDSSIASVMDELGLDDDTKNKISLVGSTYKRPIALIKEVQLLEQKKANADKPDKIAIQKQIDDLHAEVRRSKEAVDTEKINAANQIKNFKIQMKQGSLYQGAKTIYDNLDPEVKQMTLDSLINKHLQDNNAHFTFDENGNFVLLKKDGTNYYGDDNKQINAQQFVEQILSRHKLLVTTQQTQPANGSQNNSSANNNNGQNQPAPNGGSAGNGNTNSGSAMMKEIMAGINKDLETSHSVPVFGSGN